MDKAMLKKTLLGVLVVIILSTCALWLAGGDEVYALYRATSVSTAPADYALQDDSRVIVPAPQPHVNQSYNALKNVYWGDLHVHTVESFDAVLFGTTLTIEDAYRFAQGESLRSSGGRANAAIAAAGLSSPSQIMQRVLVCGRAAVTLTSRIKEKPELLANGNAQCRDIPLVEGGRQRTGRDTR